MHRRTLIKAAAGLAAVHSAPAMAAGSLDQRTSAAGDAAAARRYHAERRHLPTRFGRIAYVERGHGPVALFLHGFPLNSFQWRGALDRLSDERRCIAPDFMGLGFTDIDDGQDVTPRAQADMIAAFLDGLGVGSVDLIANDSGGAVAQLFLLRHPGRVRTLLLTNCDVEPDSPPPALLPVIELARAGTYPDDWLVPWLADKALARSAEGIGGMCYSDPGQPTDAAIEHYFGPLVATARSKALVNAYTLGLEPNPLAGVEAALGRVTVPTRIVWGMADAIFSSASPDYLDRLLPNSRGVRRVPEGKLFFPEEYPDLIAAECRALWTAA